MITRVAASASCLLYAGGDLVRIVADDGGSGDGVAARFEKLRIARPLASLSSVRVSLTVRT